MVTEDSGERLRLYEPIRLLRQAITGLPPRSTAPFRSPPSRNSPTCTKLTTPSRPAPLLTESFRAYVDCSFFRIRRSGSAPSEVRIKRESGAPTGVAGAVPATVRLRSAAHRRIGHCLFDGKAACRVKRGTARCRRLARRPACRFVLPKTSGIRGLCKRRRLERLLLARTSHI